MTLNASQTVERAANLARFIHAAQVDKIGQPYILHPMRVVGHLIESPEFQALSPADQMVAECVAWLHDAIEDAEENGLSSEWASEAVSSGFPSAVYDGVWAMTRQKDVSPEDYYVVINSDPIARAVKLADLADNTDPQRVARLNGATRTRLAIKYAKAFRALGREDRAAALEQAQQEVIS